MRVVDILAGFVPLLFLGSIAWVVFRFMGRVHQTMGNDPAMTVRQLFTYGLLFFTMILVAVGGSSLVDEAVRDSPRFSNRDLAQAFSFVIVGLPVFGLLLRYVDRRLREDEAERTGAMWAVYLNVALFTTLIGAMVGAFRVIRNLLEESADVQAYDLTLFAVWAAFWILHWAYLRARHGIPGDTDLALGSIVGLSVLGVANVGLFYVLADEIYTWLTDDPITDRAGPAVPEWSALFAVGFVVWLWYWFTHYESAPRTQAWFLTVVPVGALSAFIAVIVAGAAVVYEALVWFIGNTGDDDAVRHFDQLPFLSAVFLTGLSAWLYYRWLIRAEEVRNEPSRAYDYALAGAALVAGTIGAILCLSALFIPDTVQRNDVIAGFVLLATGAPIWVFFWNSIATRVKSDGGDELRSPVVGHTSIPQSGRVPSPRSFLGSSFFSSPSRTCSTAQHHGTPSRTTGMRSPHSSLWPLCPGTTSRCSEPNATSTKFNLGHQRGFTIRGTSSSWVAMSATLRRSEARSARKSSIGTVPIEPTNMFRIRPPCSTRSPLRTVTRCWC